LSSSIQIPRRSFRHNKETTNRITPSILIQLNKKKKKKKKKFSKEKHFSRLSQLCLYIFLIACPLISIDTHSLKNDLKNRMVTSFMKVALGFNVWCKSEI